MNAVVGHLRAEAMVLGDSTRTRHLLSSKLLKALSVLSDRQLSDRS